jgi:hypothetical protein
LARLRYTITPSESTKLEVVTYGVPVVLWLAWPWYIVMRPKSFELDIVVYGVPVVVWRGWTTEGLDDSPSEDALSDEEDRGVDYVIFIRKDTPEELGVRVGVVLSSRGSRTVSDATKDGRLLTKALISGKTSKSNRSPWMRKQGIVLHQKSHLFAVVGRGQSRIPASKMATRFEGLIDTRAIL